MHFFVGRDGTFTFVFHLLFNPLPVSFVVVQFSQAAADMRLLNHNQVVGTRR